MRIETITIKNYRNIDGIAVELHPECNYILGENNLGKSNFLHLLNMICNGKSFDDDDFSDAEMPIEVNLKLRLEAGEGGFFDDNFSPEDMQEINILYSQRISEAYPTAFCTDTDEQILLKQLRKINFFNYESTADPNKELKLDNKRGMGMLMTGLVDRFLMGKEDTSFLNDPEIENLAQFINEHLSKIQGFKTYQIGAAVSSDVTDVLSRLFYLSDGNRQLNTTGAGVQYIAMASVSVLCHIMELSKNKSMPLENRTFTDSDGKKILSMILAIDEPEVHLHPYLQRSLIGFYRRILQNKDDSFIELLRVCFGIDGLSGQIIIVTHSTDALVGDYRNLLRFYKDRDGTKVVCGSSQNLRITDVNEKHLIMHFPEIKEAFYSHCAILMEGETEYGCINAFSDKLGISLDDLGICVINARGENSIAPLRILLKAFHIPSVAIYDGDVKDVRPTGTEFFTTELCFEIEIVKTLYKAGRADLIKEIARDLYPKATTEVVDADFLKKHYKKMKLEISTYKPCVITDVDEKDETTFCNIFSAWYMAKKGVLLGRIVGEKIPKEFIPECYSRAIRKTAEVAVNV